MEEPLQPHEIIQYSSSRFSELFEKAGFLYQSGLSLQKIADRMQVAKATVRKTLLDGGVRIHPHAGTPEGSLLLRKRQRACSNAPYGYAFLDGKLMIHPKEIENVRRIVQMSKLGLSFCAIAKAFNAKCVAPRSGKKWDHSVISDILRRESDESLRRVRGEL